MQRLSLKRKISVAQNLYQFCWKIEELKEVLYRKDKEILEYEEGYEILKELCIKGNIDKDRNSIIID